MSGISISTASRVIPTLYAYTTPEIARHQGWTKIGYTEQDVKTRIEQQTHTANVKWKLEWRANAIYEDGSGESFRDSDFHAYLKRMKVEREKGTEWFHISGPASKKYMQDFKESRGTVKLEQEVIPYTLRREQAQAVSETAAYYADHPNGSFLWNAKPRFGKTLSVYDFCKTIGAEKVLIVTNRPAIANSWYSDYAQFLGQESGYLFVSTADSISESAGVYTKDEFNTITRDDESKKLIAFLSLQDLKGAIPFGGKFDKLQWVKDLQWDLLVIDEAHEGVDTLKTDVAFDQIKRNFTLHLSGTPFKALAGDKFRAEEIFNWTYADEQAAKRDWDDSQGENPYQNLPRLNLYTYQMSDIIKDEIDRGMEIDGETEEYAFDLNEFFETDKQGRFVHNAAINRFLDALTTQTKYPFSTPELRNELKHTFWLLNRVDSARALAEKLKKHKVFKDYDIVLAAGDGKLDDTDETQKAFDRVREAIRSGKGKSITLSVGQLTTGVTIPEWTAVLMLSNLKSPALYMQAAFRSQNPCLFHENGQCLRKMDAYVFDFDPARTLIIFEEFANDLSADTAKGGGDIEKRKKHVRELLNFFPVLAEDEEGEMIELDAEKVLSIPRKIKSKEVVRRGFMSNYLFQNISNIFGAPAEVYDILGQFPPTPEPATPLGPSMPSAEDLSLDDTGEVNVSNEIVIAGENAAFGDKKYEDLGVVDAGEILDGEDSKKTEENDTDKAESLSTEKVREAAKKLKETVKDTSISAIMDVAKEHYGDDLKPADQKRIERSLGTQIDQKVDRIVAGYEIDCNTLAEERKKLLETAASPQQEYKIKQDFDRKMEERHNSLQQELQEAVDTFTDTAKTEVVKKTETAIRERARDEVQETVRDHLRGFARTIPSFLMAYGDETVGLANFDKIIPEQVFKDVTSITLEQFRFLRDGGDYTDGETGEKKHFAGNLFNPVVFDDSVKEFLRLRRELADYFNEDQQEDIFDYIPPQKTNQIYTPKKTVQQMVEMLEQENPGCYDDPDKTFIDLYMKSGLYITEIVKRLYRSERMKRLYPDSEERLDHIFSEQVYGLAPTEIIYKIATNFILGFREGVEIRKHNFRCLDALPYAKAGTLSQKLDEVYGK